jgi:hypothetical protein
MQKVHREYKNAEQRRDGVTVLSVIHVGRIMWCAGAEAQKKQGT